MSFLKEEGGGGGGRNEGQGGVWERKEKEKTKNLSDYLSGSFSTEVPPVKAPPWHGQTTKPSGSLGKSWTHLHLNKITSILIYSFSKSMLPC